MEKKAGATLAKFGGSLVLRGKVDQVLVGEKDHQAVGIIRFAYIAALHTWYRSEEYQALIPLRSEAVDMTMVCYEEPN